MSKNDHMADGLKHRTFLRFYFSFMVAQLAYKSIITGLTLFVDPSTGPMLFLQTLSGLVGGLGLVLSIVASIFIYTNHYPKILLLLPICYITFGILGAAVTFTLLAVYPYFHFTDQPLIVTGVIVLLRTILVLCVAVAVGLKFTKL